MYDVAGFFVRLIVTLFDPALLILSVVVGASCYKKSIAGVLGGPAGALVGATLGNILRQPGTKANIAFGLDSARSAMNSPTARLMESLFSEIRPPATAGAYAGERAKESYADMLRRYGVNITLGQ